MFFPPDLFMPIHTIRIGSQLLPKDKFATSLQGMVGEGSDGVPAVVLNTLFLHRGEIVHPGWEGYPKGVPIYLQSALTGAG